MGMCGLIYVWSFVSRCVCVWVFVGVIVVYCVLCTFVCMVESIYVSPHKCLQKSIKQVTVLLLLGCYLSVWHCYLGSILAFNIVILISYNLWTKPLNQLRFIIETVYVSYLELVVFIYFVMNKFWLIDWLIDCHYIIMVSSLLNWKKHR